MRVPAKVEDEKVRDLERQVITYAETHGLYFVRFFHEFNCGSREAYQELIDELVRVGARHIVVPSLRHLAQNEFLQSMMLQDLEFMADFRVLPMRLKTEIE